MSEAKKNGPDANNDRSALKTEPRAARRSKPTSSRVTAIHGSWSKRAARLNGRRNSTALTEGSRALLAKVREIRKMPGVDSPAAWLASLPGAARDRWIQRLSEREAQVLEYQ